MMRDVPDNCAQQHLNMRSGTKLKLIYFIRLALVFELARNLL